MKISKTLLHIFFVFILSAFTSNGQTIINIDRRGNVDVKTFHHKDSVNGPKVFVIASDKSVQVNINFEDSSSVVKPDVTKTDISTVKPKTVVAEIPKTKEIQPEERQEIEVISPSSYSTWKMGVSTNLLGDIIAIPNIGLEFQLPYNMSLSVNGLFTKWNLLARDKNTLVYGFSPELRYWLRGAMGRGLFFGLHGDFLWYTLKWTNGHLYQNIDNAHPAWSVGLTNGYSIFLDRKKNFTMTFFLSLGYGQYRQDEAEWDNSKQKWVSILSNEQKNEIHQYIGATKVGICLNYTIPFQIKKKVN